MTNVDVKVSMPIFPNDQCTISLFQQLYHLNSCLTDLLLCLSKKGIKERLVSNNNFSSIYPKD